MGGVGEVEVSIHIWAPEWSDELGADLSTPKKATLAADFTFIAHQPGKVAVVTQIDKAVAVELA